MIQNSLTTSAASLMAIEAVTVLPGATPFKEEMAGNINDTFRGQVLTRGGETRFAIIKDLYSKELANELLVAVIGRALGLAMPDSYLGLAEADVLTLTKGPQMAGGRLVFVSCDVGFPNLFTKLNNKIFQKAALRKIVEILCKNNLSALYEFDTWSANIDRHPGNLLVGGDGKIWLIDHGWCFTGPAWEAADLAPSETYLNKLDLWVAPNLSDEEIATVSASVGILSEQLRALDLPRAAELSFAQSLLSSGDLNALLQFLVDRLDATPRITANSLGRLI